MNTHKSRGWSKILTLIFLAFFVLGAAGTPSSALVDTEGTWSDYDQDGLNDGWENILAERFAPLVYLHHHEEHFPSSIDWYLDRTWLGYGADTLFITNQVDPVGSVNALISQSHQVEGADTPTYSGAVNQLAAGWANIAQTDYFLEAKGDSVHAGDKSTGVYGHWPVYVHVLRSPETLEFPETSGSYHLSHPGMIDIQYWFFYPYNGALGWTCEDSCNPGLDICCPALAGGSHEGDWEYVIVRVQADGETIHSIYYSRHSGEGRWETSDGYTVRTDTPGLLGPIVYSAHHSHANFTHAGRHAEGSFTPDFTNAGITWDTSTHLINIGELWHPMEDMEWIQYTGRWGEMHFEGDANPHGPYGPAHKAPWAGNAEGNRDNLLDLTIHTNPVATSPADQSTSGGTLTTFNLGSFTDTTSATSWTVVVNWGDGRSSTFSTTSKEALSYVHYYHYQNPRPEPVTKTYTVAVYVSNGFTSTTSPAVFHVSVAYPGDQRQDGPNYYVNSGSPGSDGVCGNVHCSLTEAIDAANDDDLASVIYLQVDAAAIRENMVTSPITIVANGAYIQPERVTPGHVGNRLFKVAQGGDLTIVEADLEWGRADFGGAIWNEGTLTLSKSTLKNNTALESGGAIYNLGTLTISRSTLSSNQAYGDGGAIYSASTSTIVNSTFWDNQAGYIDESSGWSDPDPDVYYPGKGGAIFNDGALTMLSSTLANNRAASSCDTANPEAGSANLCNNLGTATVKNTILASVAFEVELHDPYGPDETLTFNNGSCSGTSLVTTSIAYTDSSCGPNPVTDLKLGTFGFNCGIGGCPTETVALLRGGPAIDKGNTTACKDPMLYSYSSPNVTLWSDQRGFGRFADGNGDGIKGCDIGAYEYNATLGGSAPAPDVAPPLTRILLTPATPDGANGWYLGPVTVKPEARDNDSGVIELRCALDPQTVPTTYADLPEDICPFLAGAPVSDDGLHSLYIAAMDEAGNQSAVLSKAFQIDATPPVFETCPAAGPFLLNSGDQTVGPASVDASVSGLDEAASTLSGIVATESVGPKPLTFTAIDLASNFASLDCSYEVIFDFGGFYPPVEPAPTFNPAEAGSAIPIKFSLAGDQGLDILAERFPIAQQVDPQTLEPIGESFATKPAGNSGLSYDPETGWYIYVWKTDKGWTGTWKLTIQLIDGTQHVAYFQFQ